MYEESKAIWVIKKSTVKEKMFEDILHKSNCGNLLTDFYDPGFNNIDSRFSSRKHVLVMLHILEHRYAL